MKNVIKYYEFSNDIKQYKVLDCISSFLVLPIAPIILYYFVKLMIIEKIFGDEFIPSNINKVIVFVAFILGLIWLIKFKTSLKGLFLYDNYLQIERHSFTKYYMFNINPKIKYSEITSCTICPKESRSYKEWNEKQLYFVGGSADEYVRLETKNDKIYCFCIENQEEFVEEVLRRKNALENK